MKAKLQTHANYFVNMEMWIGCIVIVCVNQFLVINVHMIIDSSLSLLYVITAAIIVKCAKPPLGALRTALRNCLFCVIVVVFSWGWWIHPCHTQVSREWRTLQDYVVDLIKQNLLCELILPGNSAGIRCCHSLIKLFS